MTAPERPSALGKKSTLTHLHDDGFGLFIVAEGNIGSGKSSFCTLLANHRKQSCRETNEVLLEPVDHPRFRDLLGLYGGAHTSQTGPEWDDLSPEQRLKKAMSRWGFALQIHALTERHAQHRLAIEMVSNGTTVIQDRSIFADGCFGMVVREDGNMTDHEWGIYADLFGRMKRDLRYPDVMVYLRTDPSECHKRMRIRARAQEAIIPLDYLKKIHDKHEELAEGMSRYMPVLILDWNFLGHDMGEISRQLDEICEEQKQHRFIRDFRRL